MDKRIARKVTDLHFSAIGVIITWVMNDPLSLPEVPGPPPGRLVAGYFCNEYGYHVRRTSGTRDWLLTLTLSGEGVYRLGNKTHVCQRGNIVLLAPGTPHDYAAASGNSGWEFFWVHFTPQAAWVEWLKWACSNAVNELTITDTAEYTRLYQAFHKLVQDNRNINFLHDELADNALAEILILLTAHHNRNNAHNLDSRIAFVLRRLADEYDRDLSVADLAESVAMSPSRLAHLFAMQTGDPIMRVRMKLRMRHAARLLEISTKPVSDIASDVGFNSLFHFSRQFSRWHDMSPTAYRQRLRANR